MAVVKEKQGISPDQLYRNTMKNLTSLQNNIQLMFDGISAMSAELNRVNDELESLKGKGTSKKLKTMREPETKLKINTKKKKHAKR